MVAFQELPIDILPVVLDFLLKSSHLASAAKVNKTWNEFVTPRLYDRISVFSWHKEWKNIIRSLFATLASCTHLARHVRRLEIRDFPKAAHWAPSPETTRILEDTISGLKNCISLRSCTWTRDGSITDEILNALTSLPNLYELELNGHDSVYYDHKILRQFTQLQKISVIMPSPEVVRSLRDMVLEAGERLRSLNMICKASGAVTDSILEDMAPKLVNLEHFSLTGCPKVTERGVLAIVSSTHVGIKSLGLENVSTRFDMAKFSDRCTQTQALRFLDSVTLTVSLHITDRVGWTKSVLALLSSSPLNKFHIYSTHITPAGALTNSEPKVDTIGATGIGPYTMANVLALFYRDLAAAHGQTLTRFSVLRMPISLVSIRAICAGCPNLEELFVVTNSKSLHDLPNALAPAKKLRTVHINFPVRNTPRFTDTDEQSKSESDSDLELEGGDREQVARSRTSSTFVFPNEALLLVKRCSPTLTQYGCNTRVWKVGRTTKKEEDGSVSAEVVLLPYENPDIPEPFLVVRT